MQERRSGFAVVPKLVRCNFRLLQEIIAAFTVEDLRVALGVVLV